MATKPKPVKLTIDAWPKLIETLNSPRFAFFGDTPEQVAKFLLVSAVEQRLNEYQRNERAQDERYAAANKSRW